MKNLWILSVVGRFISLTIAVIALYLFTLSNSAKSADYSIPNRHPIPNRVIVQPVIPNILITKAFRYLNEAYAVQLIATRCGKEGVIVKGLVIQEPEGEETAPFIFNDIQKQILLGFPDKLAQDMNKQSYFRANDLVAKTQYDLKLEDLYKDPVNWCSRVAPAIVKRLLYGFNTSFKNTETADFREFVYAKDLYFKSVQALGELTP